MNSDIFAQCRQWFDEHTAHYREKAGPEETEMVDRKIRHTMRVVGHVQAIVAETPPLEELSEAVEVAALLHDAGRFPQVVKHNSYDDHATCNHAEVGARIVMDADLLDPLPLETRGIVLSAVKYHNVAVIPDNLGTEARLVLEVLRDADKLDALRNSLRYLDPDNPNSKALKAGLTWDADKFTPELLQYAMDRTIIPYENIQWSNDFALFLSCWLYDLHFPYAFRQLKTSGQYEILLGQMPDTEEFIRLKEQLRDDLDWILARSRS